MFLDNSPRSLAILGRMGEVLLQIQMTEHALNICVDYFVPKPGDTLEMLLADDEDKQRWTLGRFLQELRQRLDIHPGFDEVLRLFLEDRNKFIHRIFTISGFGLHDNPDPDKAMAFLKGLSSRAEHVRNVFAGHVDLIATALDLTDNASSPLDLTNTKDFYKNYGRIGD